MTGTVQLILMNSAEYLLRNPSFTLTGPERDGLVTYVGTSEAEHAVFWSVEPRVLVLPHGFDRQWYTDVHRALGVDEPPVVAPRPVTGMLVPDLIKDGAAQNELRHHLLTYDRVELLVTGPTPETYQLAEIVRGWGLPVEIDHLPEERYWASLYLDSKISCMDLAREMPGEVDVAPGMTFCTWTELTGGLRAMLERHGTVVARTLYGVSGAGTAVIRNEPGSVEAFIASAAKDSFFAFPILVQRFVPHAEGVGCPAADILIGEDGVENIVLCSLTVKNGHVFRSVDVGDGALPPVWGDRMRAVSRSLGTAAHRLGYRGWMCVDAVAGTDDILYVTEINARRSGSMHACMLLKNWDAERDLTLSAHFVVEVPSWVTYADHVRPIFQRLWADGVRAYPTSVRGLSWPDSLFAVIAAAPTAAEANKIVSGIRDAIDALQPPALVTAEEN
ncbi:hypothetical protein [Actinoplanes subglobosus]|uniref:ATP-grasp domain-containing protein n=1 Tax=Actinoplanes subglobosus TaxID=1547892 RepID=A0ABV8J0E6_9ACTN